MHTTRSLLPIEVPLLQGLESVLGKAASFSLPLDICWKEENKHWKEDLSF